MKVSALLLVVSLIVLSKAEPCPCKVGNETTFRDAVLSNEYLYTIDAIEVDSQVFRACGSENQWLWAVDPCKKYIDSED